MNLAISSLGWDFDNNQQVLPFLQKNGIKYIEVVFPKLGEWSEINSTSLSKFKNLLNDFKLKAHSTQSIFYNSGVNSLSDIKLIENHIQLLTGFCDFLGFFGSSLKSVDAYIFINGQKGLPSFSPALNPGFGPS